MDPSAVHGPDDASGLSFLSAAMLAGLALLASDAVGQDPARLHGKQPKTLEIKNVHVVPAFGPTSVFVRDGKIAEDAIEAPEQVIDGTSH